MSETTETSTETTETSTGTAEGKDWQAEAEKWKQLARKHESTAKGNADAVKRLAEIEEASKSEQEKAVTAAKAEADKAARAEVTERYQRRIVTAEVKAAAGGKLADPADAVRLLDLAQFDLDENDEVDGKAVAKAIDDLLKAKPYLAAKQSKAGGDAGQGPREEAEASTGFGPTRLRAARRDTK